MLTLFDPTVSRDVVHHGKDARLERHHGQLVLVDRSPIHLAKMPADAPILESTFVHPRYVSDDDDACCVSVRGRMCGRSIDIVLDEPVVHKKRKYWVLNIKGVGANATFDMMFHPTKWYHKDSVSGAHMWSDDDLNMAALGRVWGAVRLTEGIHEFSNDVFTPFGLPQTPYLRLNRLPHIAALDGSSSYKPRVFCQIQRGLTTNIRITDGGRFYNRKQVDSYVDAAFLAVTDVSFIQTQVKSLGCTSSVLDMDFGTTIHNRYMTGEFTDRENYHIEFASPDAERRDRCITAIAQHGAMTIAGSLFAVHHSSSALQQYICMFKRMSPIRLDLDRYAQDLEEVPKGYASYSYQHIFHDLLPCIQCRVGAYAVTKAMSTPRPWGRRNLYNTPISPSA